MGGSTATKVIVVGPIVCVSALIGLFLAGWGRSSPANTIDVQPPIFTSIAREGETVNARFTISNHSEQPVKLLGATVSCSCTVPEGLPVEIAPNASATILVKYAVGHPNSAGKAEQQLALLSNSDLPIAPLKIEISVSKGR